MDINRKTAFLVLEDIEDNKAYSNLSLNNFIARENPNNVAFVREIVYGVLKNKYLLDFYLKQLVAKGYNKLKTADLCLLRMGAYQVLMMGSVPTYAAISETVNLAKKYARGRDKFINAVLRNMSRVKLAEPEESGRDFVEIASIEYSLETWIVKLLVEAYGEAKAVRILKSLMETSELVIRVNLKKTSVEDLAGDLKAQGFDVKRSELSKRALIVKGSGVLDTQAFKNGYFSVQDLSSISAIDTFDVSRDAGLVIDCCAAPGGKSFAMAETLSNESRVCSFDLYEKKVELMKKDAKRLGLTNVNPMVHDSTQVCEEFIGKADYVLTDVPCSGLGVMRRKPEIRYREEYDMNELVEIQRKILEAGSKYVKVGGFLMYSTCTINPKENEDQVAAFVANHEDFEVVAERLMLPCEGTDGFYLAKMRRKDAGRI